MHLAKVWHKRLFRMLIISLAIFNIAKDLVMNWGIIFGIHNLFLKCKIVYTLLNLFKKTTFYK